MSSILVALMQYEPATIEWLYKTLNMPRPSRSYSLPGIAALEDLDLTVSRTWAIRTQHVTVFASWILCATIPTHRLTRTLVLSTIIAISAMYVWVVPSFFLTVGTSYTDLTCVCDAVSVPDGAGGQTIAAGPPFDWSTIAGVAAMFQSAGLSQMAGAWIHYLAFDLFVGWTIARDAAAVGISKFFVAPCLLFTFALGPTGALMYLGLKGVLGRSGVRGQLI
ncbi:hypothetical protein BCR44DRAFT_40752 [Catenaria anguillulae PL171]|uniref:Uncharacterized protein n=1 Tax=Catenaria anguillulae PL171 TaxID=765915 RepID=A0A1Y2HS34_9FUNG|nr:hypothetical protein BCR44DRAFT_40752 [Catenaria anguillulae PL171]